tara:strand:- start:3792 stop:4679 length:888 start_codon:yes stop_codon:yes gene_type:complete
MNHAEWLIVDWGTTNFRAFAIDENGEVLSKLEKPMGLLQVNNGDFSGALESVLKNWLENYQELPVYMAGMVGSAQGWVPVPYEKTPVKLVDIANKSTRFTLSWGAEAVIVPGIYDQSNCNNYDVMRGEEVQLLGLQNIILKDEFIAVLPGTHSKHVMVKEKKVETFKTYMTGEFFSILSKYSIIGMGLPAQENSSSSFLKGVLSDRSGELLNTVFSARTLRIFEKIKETEVLDYLSGLLIGHELSHFKNETVYIVGNTFLSEKYRLACDSLGLKYELVNGDLAFLEGMKQVREML